MWNSLGVNPETKFNNDNHIIYAQDTTGDGNFNHFVNGTGTDSTGRETYFDPWTGKTGYVDEIKLATEGNGATRTFVVYN